MLHPLLAMGHSDHYVRGVPSRIADEASRTIDRAFAIGFLRHPDYEEEAHRTTRLAIESIEEEPWEKWW